MKYSMYERETSIVWDDQYKVAAIYTASPSSMRKLDKLCQDHPTEYKRTWQEIDPDGSVTAARYETSCKMIRFAKPVSEARREASRRAALNAGFNRK